MRTLPHKKTTTRGNFTIKSIIFSTPVTSNPKCNSFVILCPSPVAVVNRETSTNDDPIPFKANPSNKKDYTEDFVRIQYRKRYKTC